jgi:hypothetical protein
MNAARCITSTSRSQQSFDGLGRLVDEVFRAIVVTAGGCSGDAVMQVLVEQLHADSLQSFADRGDLREHVDAVCVVFDHSPETTDLAFDTPQPGE